MQNSAKGVLVYINAWRNITTDPIENNHVAVYHKTYLVSPDDNLASSEQSVCGETLLVLLPEDADGGSVAVQTVCIRHRAPLNTRSLTLISLIRL